MVIALIVVALAMLVAGLVAIAGGSEGIGFESGWALVIAGTVASTGGILVLALAFILRELRTLPDRLEAAHPLDDMADRQLPPFENLAPAALQAEAEPVLPGVKEPSFARLAGPVAERAAPSGSGLPQREAAAAEAEAPLAADFAVSREAKGAEPVDKAPSVFPDFSPRALLEASRAKAKKRAKPDDTEDATAHERPERVEPTLPMPADMTWAGQEERETGAAGMAPGEPAEEAPDAAAGPQSGKAAGEPGKDGPAIVGTYRSNGTVYVMYADGSIEADTPEGVFRFGSLEELKAHIAAGSEQGNDKRLSSPA